MRERNLEREMEREKNIWLEGDRLERENVGERDRNKWGAAVPLVAPTAGPGDRAARWPRGGTAPEARGGHRPPHGGGRRRLGYW